jgi:hypothetical protein
MTVPPKLVHCVIIQRQQSPDYRNSIITHYQQPCFLSIWLSFYKQKEEVELYVCLTGTIIKIHLHNFHFPVMTAFVKYFSLTDKSHFV